MTPRRTPSTPSALLWVLLLAAVLVLWAVPASAFHFPWDQGHDTFDPDHGDDEEPEEDKCEAEGSPFEAQTGSFLYSVEDVSWSGLGPGVRLVRSYHSDDRRDGPFGPGWAFSYDQRLIEVTDGIELSVICRKGDGKRTRFRNLPDGSFEPPSEFFSELVRETDGSLTLRESNGSERRFDSSGRLTAIVDWNGNALTLSYDPTGFPISIRDAAGRELQLTKGPNGKVASIEDPLGRLYLYEYDTQGRLQRFTNPLGEVTEYQYDTEGRLTRILDPQSRVVQEVTYDAEGRVLSYIEDGATWSVSHAPSQRKVVKRDPAGNAWTVFYNEHGNVTRRVDPDGSTVETVYTADFRIDSVIDARGGSKSFTYDARGNLLSETDELDRVTTYTYEPGTDRLIEVSRPNGAATTFAYDERGNRIQATDAVGNSISYSYDAAGQLIEVVRGDGESEQYQYDASGNVTSVTDAAGGVTSFTYDAMGNVVSMTDPDGYTFLVEYDALGRRSRLTDPAGNETQFSYAAACPVCSDDRRVSRVVDPSGAVTVIEWDRFGRRVGATDPLGNSANWSYDALGNLVRYQDPAGQATAYGFDSVGRLVQVTAPDGGETRYDYDADGNLLSVTDPGGAVTTFTYDLADQVTSVDSPDSGLLTFTYDVVGNIVKVLDATGVDVDYSYDLEGRPTGVGYPDATLDLAYRYDETGVAGGAGRFTGYSDPSGTTSRHYRADGELIQVDTHRLGIDYSTTYEHSPAGRLQTMTYPSGLVVSYGYDSHGFVSQVAATPAGGTTQVLVSGIQYDAVGRRSAMTFGNGLQETRGYDLAGRLSSLALSGFDQASYSYDAVGRMSGITNALDPVADRSFSRDSVGRLTGATGPWGGLTFAYDGNGNRTQETDTAGTATYTYTANRLDSISGAESASYSFDAAGRVVSNGNLDFTYADNGRLVKVSAGGVTVADYVHNAFGQRVLKTVDGVTTVFHYDKRGLLIEETDAAGMAGVSYVYLPDGTPVGRHTPSGFEYYHTDHIGTPVRLTDATASEIWSSDQRPFGEAHSTSGSAVQNLRFQGHYYDEETGLHYNWNRYYEPSTGRYLRPDPIGLTGGLNPYRYAENQPTRYVDPSGLFNFVWHYYFGGGKAISLGSVGLLGTFRNAPSVTNAVNEFREEAEKKARSEAKSLCPKCTKGVQTTIVELDKRTVTDVTDVDGLFAVGHSTFFREARCDVVAYCDAKQYSFFCSFTFYIRDEFADPVGLGIEVGGTPYDINADWTESLHGSGTF